jgi:hypothetical protein
MATKGRGPMTGQMERTGLTIRAPLEGGVDNHLARILPTAIRRSLRHAYYDVFQITTLSCIYKKYNTLNNICSTARAMIKLGI